MWSLQFVCTRMSNKFSKMLSNSPTTNRTPLLTTTSWERKGNSFIKLFTNFWIHRNYWWLLDLEDGRDRDLLSKNRRKQRFRDSFGIAVWNGSDRKWTTAIQHTSASQEFQNSRQVFKLINSSITPAGWKLPRWPTSIYSNKCTLYLTITESW